MAHDTAIAAPETKGFPGDPFHDPFHAAGFRAANPAWDGYHRWPPE
jgi:hypothetical protein